jgi:hypothetical protein
MFLDILSVVFSVEWNLFMTDFSVLLQLSIIMVSRAINYDGSGEFILEIAKRFSRLWRLGFGRRTNRDSVIPYNPVDAK